MNNKKSIVQAMQLPVNKLHPFEGHPFQVKDDAEMDQLVWSILTQGLLTPITVRPLENNEYEVISGHRRLHACQKAGIETVPALIYALDRDEATIAMVDSNLHREKILPSEKAFAYKMKIKTFDGDGELRLTIMATLAQDESRKTSIRVKSGQQTSMNNGVYYGNGNILGYDRVEEILPDKTKLVEYRINPEQATTVRLIYDMYLDGHGLAKIKDELERRGYKTSQGMESWYPTVISHVLKNSFYCGILTYHKEYVPDYLKQKKVKNYGEIEFTQVEGTHTPIVTVEEFERVQRIMEQKRTECKNLNMGPRSKGKKPRTTVWGKLLICECGHTFNTRRWDRAGRQPGNAYQCYSSVRTGSYESRKKKGLPLDGICQSPMIPEWRLQMMANLIFRKYLSEKDKVLALANSILEAHIGDTEEVQDMEAILASKRSELERLNRRMDNYIEMRADGDLSREQFRTRCAELEPKIQQLQEEIETLTAKAQPREVVDYTEKLTVLQYALEQYTNRDEGQDVPESVIEAFVVKIVVSKDGFDWYLRFDGDPDKPLHCQLQGKRKQTTKIMVSGGNSPTMDNSATGCYQGLKEVRHHRYNNHAPVLRNRGVVRLKIALVEIAKSLLLKLQNRYV